MHRKLFSSYFYVLLQGYTNFMILQGVSNLWNMPKLDQLKSDFSALSLPATSLSLSLPHCLSHSLSVYRVQLNFRAQMSSLNGNPVGSTITIWVAALKPTKKKERERGRKAEREREVSNWAALLKWPQVPSSSNTNNKPSRAGEKGGQGGGLQLHAAVARTGAD